MTSRRITLARLGGVLSAASAPAWLRGALAAEPLMIGFVYVSPVGDVGWTWQHELGRREMERALGGRVQSRYVDNVPEGADAERVIRELAQDGRRLIFTTSFGYMNPTEKVARAFPGTVFMHATGYKTARNLGVYNARFYEGRYLCGVIGGRMTRSHVFGYVAAFPIPEVLQGINAFTLGARSVDPKAEVRVVWTNSWYDPGREREAAQALMAQGADTLTHHTDSAAVLQTAEEAGKHAFAYHSDMSKYAPHAQLAASTHLWGAFYTRTATEVIEGRWHGGRTWGGIREGMVKLAGVSAAVPAETRDRVARLEADIRDGHLHPFTGPVLDQDGRQRLAAGEVMGDEALGAMDYYVAGVAGRLPHA